MHENLSPNQLNNESDQGLVVMDFDTYANQVFDSIIAELRAQPHVEQPTKYEQIINMIRSGQEVTISNLARLLYKDTDNPRKQARIGVHKLNVLKLNPHGLDFDRSDNLELLPIADIENDEID